jgi:hypothetical protein
MMDGRFSSPRLQGRNAMTTIIFVVCATIGGTVLVIQFIMALIGLGGHVFDLDVTGDVGHDFSGEFHGDAGGEFHGDAGTAGHHDSDVHHGSMWLFRVLSLRTVTAALAFFGIGGLAAQSADAPMPMTLGIALGSGAAAMAGVYWIMRGLQELRAEGTQRIQRSIGQHGNAYLRIPSKHSGNGKVQISLQNRTVEYLAVTAGPEIPTGTKIVVVGVVNPTTLEVQPE